MAGGFLLFDGCTLKMGKQPRQEIAPLYSARSPEFQQAAGSLLGPNFVSGNSIGTTAALYAPEPGRSEFGSDSRLPLRIDQVD